MPINWNELHLNWQALQAQANNPAPIEAVNPVHPDVQHFVDFEAQQVGVNVAAPKPKISIYDEFRYPREVRKTSAIVANQQQHIRELEKALGEYNGYITQRQLLDAVNRVLASKKIKRWRPSIGSNKSEFLSEFINVLWAAIPDPVQDSDACEA